MVNDNSEWIIITNIDRDIYAWCPDRAILLKLNSARWKNHHAIALSQNALSR